jgi:prolyl-tRNA synthetase
MKQLKQYWMKFMMQCIRSKALLNLFFLLLLFFRIEKSRNENMIICTNWPEFTPALDQKKIILSPFCGEPACEDRIKNDSTRDEPAGAGVSSMGAKTLCIPLKQPEQELPKQCIHPKCENASKFFALFGRSY